MLLRLWQEAHHNLYKEIFRKIVPAKENFNFYFFFLPFKTALFLPSKISSIDVLKQ